MRALRHGGMIALFLISACAESPTWPAGELRIQVSLQPALDAGIQPTRVLATARRGANVWEQELAIDGASATGTFAELSPGDYALRVAVHAGIPAYAAGEETAAVRGGQATQTGADLVDWNRHYPDIPRRVLFVGNSLTGANDGLDEHFVPLADAAWDFLGMQADMVARGGYSLASHWFHGDAVDAIAEGDYDCVVLQGSPSAMVNEPESYAEHAALFVEHAREHGAATVLLVPHSYEDEDQYAATLQELVAASVLATGARPAPVCQAWYRCLADHPEIDLYRDYVHQTPAGSYLYLAVLVGTLLQTAPGAGDCNLTAVFGDDERAAIDALAWAAVREQFDW